MTDWKRGKRRKEKFPADLLLGHAVKSCMTVIRMIGWGAIASDILQGILAGALNAGVCLCRKLTENSYIIPCIKFQAKNT